MCRNNWLHLCDHLCHIRCMKIWLDDIRIAPPNWVHCCWPDEVIRLFETENVTEISLDHDLGDSSITGYTVLLWLEEEVFNSRIIPPLMHVHSANPVAKIKMLSAIDRINRLYAEQHRHQ